MKPAGIVLLGCWHRSQASERCGSSVVQSAAEGPHHPAGELAVAAAARGQYSWARQVALSAVTDRAERPVVSLEYSACLPS